MLKKFTLYFILIFLLWLLILFIQASNPTKSTQWVFDVYNKKYNIAMSIKKPKIVVMAGSNALFGINSKMLENKFKMPVVNYGVNAGIDLPLILYLTKRILKPKDIVIVPLEYPLYSYNAKPLELMIDYILSRESKLFFQLTLKEQLFIIWNISWKRVSNGYFYKGGKVIKIGQYGIHHIDKYGDQTYSDIKYKTSNMKNILNKFDKKPQTYGKDSNLNSLGIKYLKEFVLLCKNRNIKVLFVPSTLMYNKSYLKDKIESKFYNNLKNNLNQKGLLFIGNPYNYMQSKDNYFDTIYHLTTKARDIRTKRLIKDISQYINIKI